MYYIYDVETGIIESETTIIHSEENLKKFGKSWFKCNKAIDTSNYIIKDGSIIQISNQDDFRKIEVYTDAIVTDDTPSIPADGISYCSIFIKKVDKDDKIVYDEDEEILVSTDNGKLDKLKVMTEDGEAVVRIKSSKNTVLARVLLRPTSTEPAAINIQFLPTGD